MRIQTLALCLASVLIQTLQCQSQVTKYHPWRIVGTNLLDFSPIISAMIVSNHPAAEKYFVKGTVTGVTRSSVRLLRNLGVRYDYNPLLLDAYASGAINAIQASTYRRDYYRGTTISRFDHLKLRPDVRMKYFPVEEFHECVLSNCPPEFGSPQRGIEVFAWPIGNKDVAAHFDFGEVFAGRLEDFPYYFQITPDGLVKRTVLTSNQIAKAEAATNRKVIALYQQMAEQGFGSYQYDLALRYLNGDGLEQNNELARHWLQSAKTNDESQASKLLDMLAKTNAFFAQPK